MTAEQWRPVVGLESRYEVSDLGRVRNLANGKVITHRTHGRQIIVALSTDTGRKERVVAATVLAAFRGPFNRRGDRIEYADRDWRNVALANLAYVPSARARGNGKCGRCGGPMSKRARFVCTRCMATAVFVDEFEHMVRGGSGWGEILRQFGVKPSAIDKRLRKAGRADLCALWAAQVGDGGSWDTPGWVASEREHRPSRPAPFKVAA